MKPNPLRLKLERKDVVVGTMITTFGEADCARIIAGAQMDFTFIDSEHTPFGIETLARLCDAARRFDVAPLVRVPNTEYHLMARRLDAGALGLMVPRVESAEQVGRIVESVYYPPRGQRGCAPRPAMMDYEPASLADFIQWSNDNIVIVIQIETQRGLDRLDQILSIEGTHVALVGPADMSISLGVPGDMGSPKLWHAIDQVVAACDRHGKVAGIHAGSPEMAVECAKRGMRFLTCSSDGGLLAVGARATAGAIRGAL
ncbi:MAG: HpcH/HpaI aldolase/citrate lyase family protein [Armatimonadota bacterium]